MSDSSLLNLLLSSSAINMIYFHENMNLTNRKKGFLVVSNLKITLKREAIVYMYLINYKLELLVCFTKNCEQNFVGGGKSKMSCSLVLSSQTGIPKGPKKSKILEGRGVNDFWKRGGMGGRAIWNFRRQRGLKCSCHLW